MGAASDAGSIRPGGGVLHVLSGLDVGGKERVALELARLGRAAGRDDRLIVFDSAFRDARRDLDPGAVPVELIPRGPGLDLGFARALARRMAELLPAAVHGHNDTGVFYAGLGVALRRRGLPFGRPRFVGTLHARPIHATRGARLSTRAACATADAVTVVSDDLREWLRRAGWIGSAQTLTNGVDLRRFAPDVAGDGWRARLGLASGQPLVVHLGRLDPIKRHADLLEAAARLPRIGVLLAGTGPELARLRARIDALANVHHEEGVQRVPELLVEADLLVLCSDFEATPMVVLEALACGTPVVASDVGGVPALAREDKSGLAITRLAPRDPVALAAAIERLTSEGAGARAARRAAARALAERFGWERVLPRYEELWGVEVSAPTRGAPLR